MKTKIIIILSLLISLPTWATSQSPHKEANKWDANMQLLLCKAYMEVADVSRDYKKAILWCTKAVDQGDPNSQFLLASVYTLTKDYKKALVLYKKSAGEGNANSQLILGTMYSIGAGSLIKDKSKAKYWIKKAYENNDPYISKKAQDYWDKNIAR